LRCLHCDEVMEVHEPESERFGDPFDVIEREEELETK
jgi:hypothetical protein